MTIYYLKGMDLIRARLLIANNAPIMRIALILFTICLIWSIIKQAQRLMITFSLLVILAFPGVIPRIMFNGNDIQVDGKELHINNSTVHLGNVESISADTNSKSLVVKYDNGDVQNVHLSFGLSKVKVLADGLAKVFDTMDNLGK